MWGKFDMLRRVIDAGQHDWVWWMDFDTLITNMTTKVEDVVERGLKAAVARGDVKVGGEDEVDWLVSEDWYVVVCLRALSSPTDTFPAMASTPAPSSSAHTRAPSTSSP